MLFFGKKKEKEVVKIDITEKVMQDITKERTFVQAKRFNGFKKLWIGSHIYEKQEAIEKLKAELKGKFYNLEDRKIKIREVNHSNLFVYVEDVLIGEITKTEENKELLNAFKKDKVSAAYVGIEQTEERILYREDSTDENSEIKITTQPKLRTYLFIKIEE